MGLKILKVDINFDLELAMTQVFAAFPKFSKNNFLKSTAETAYKRAIHPGLSLELKTELKRYADTAAISIFGVNLKNLLLGPYLGAKAVMGVDPGIRTGCKIVIVDGTGKFLADTIIYPHPPQNQKEQSAKIIETAIDQLKIEYVAIGSGTYGRETLDFLKNTVTQIKSGKTKALLVNEDGASIYSTSEIARKEFPEKDPTVRGAVSIARRFQDPLAELVKIDPKSIGVGQYQHDVNPILLKKSLSSIVESCVNYVGVDVNTASTSLLSYISGIGPSVAQNIVDYRQKNGVFTSREDFLKVGRFNDKTFKMAAGFLRVYTSKNPLDATFIHPEVYEIIKKWCQANKVEIGELIKDKEAILKFSNDSSIKTQLGEFTHKDITDSLKAPRQDPRSEFQPFEYRADLTDIKQIKVGQYYPGLVTNITQFGAFVDIGIKENGLIHISQIADKFVSNPLEILKVGQEVQAWVMDIDMERKRVSMSLKSQEKINTVNSKNHSTSPQTKRNVPTRKEELKNTAFAGLKDFFKD
jgi:uncharacterized protein